jgi:ribosome biogenesis GTPase
MSAPAGVAANRARVIESYGRRVLVETPDGSQVPAELFGKRLSCVCGDDVEIRRGRTEPLAANLSLLAVIVAPEPTPDPYITDRYLAGAALAGIAAMVVVNKSELASAESSEYRELVHEYELAGYPVQRVSALEDASVQPLQAQLCSHVAMFVGQSGVGKSTLTNRLAPESARATRTLSDSTGEGRHTTVSTALFKMPAGGELIDSPGVRDYAPPLVDDATVQVGWPEILTRAPQCRFNNCLHLREPGCAVTAAVTAGEVPPRRYESYKRLLNIMRGLAPEYERRR